jgi:hypothetical protein
MRGERNIALALYLDGLDLTLFSFELFLRRCSRPSGKSWIACLAAACAYGPVSHYRIQSLECNSSF